MDTKKTALVIGTGAGGAVVARDLQGKYQVTMLEAGKEFQPFSFPVNKLAGLRRTGLFFDERLIRMFLPNMLVEKTPDMIMVRGIGKDGKPEKIVLEVINILHPTEEAYFEGCEDIEDHRPPLGLH